MKIVALVFLVLLPLFAVTVSYGTKPAEGSGTVTLTHQTKVESRLAGGNNITTFMNKFDITGALAGSAVALERDVFHSSNGVAATFQGVANFTGSAGGVSGKLVIRYVGTSNGTFIKGQFVIVSGSGGLADFHGQGAFSGKAGTALHYTIKWHFDPSPKTKSKA